ncbi:MAG TPA: hypothetical protein VJS43_08750 [Candidatus Acidoferrales bacterium]|nr:hypothetical protein [Candidatus Acidoferrales bacterium]
MKTAYKIFRWVTLASLVITILLVLHKSQPPAITVDPTAAQQAEQKFEAAAQAKAQGQPAQVQLDSTELNSFLAQNLELSGSAPASAPSQPGAGASPAAAPAVPAADPNAANTGQPSIAEVQSSVRDVKVDMEGDLIKTYIVFNLHGEDLSLELDGHLGAKNGYMKFEPVGGRIGSLPLPQSALEAAVTQMMNSPENREKLRLPDDVSDIQVQDGQVVVSYK